LAKTCLLCGQRKGKRACPAKGAEICPHCCGTKRLVEIDCPSHCAYLQGAHAAGWEGRDSDQRRVLPQLGGLTRGQAELFLVGLVGIARIRLRRRGLVDSVLSDAVSALRKTVETRSRGVLYEHDVVDPRAHGLLEDLKGLWEERTPADERSGPDDRDLLPVLAALQAALAATIEEGAGATAFLDTIGRITSRIGADPGPEGRGAQGSGGPLIITP